MTVPELIEAAKAYYAKNPVGGNLHIVLDDGNIEDLHVKWCINYAREKGDEDGVRLGEMILQASMTQRNNLVKRYEEYCS